ncbi:proline iminopeptidase-family hydrolase [Mesorhizobium temperatum]|uniref:Alpha/beta hydrolase n=1 Tax=Mesorhizobium temperatum TaxID=241416 RepID=A0A271LEJ0_9HYPH|nr:proline iminopeptidase-family hydrolase [Mesorhizobium temperatum]PAQ06519.1 alpha/beta hydrolase [Mesorhizobium temperatum]
MTAHATTEGFSDYRGYRTWYRVIGDLNSGKLPLVVAHGGPGCTHDYVDSFKELADTGRAVIHYDQIGNGKSTHLPDKGGDFWTVDFFLGELDALLAHIGVADRYALLGQSWGGILSAEHAVRRPAGLKALILANSLASMALWMEGALQLRAGLPADVQNALDRHEAAGTTDHPDYVAATKAFYDRHVCRVLPTPPEVARTFAAIEEDPTVYHTMNGPNEFHVIGTMRNWTIVERLHLIEAPTLAFRGFYDEATEACVQPFLDHIPDVEGMVFPNSSHMPHVEEKDDCLAAVGRFVAKYD